MAAEANEHALFDPVQFGNQLAARRRSLGLSQEAAAEIAGIARKHWSNLERGWGDPVRNRPAKPGIETLIGICHALDARIDFAYPSGVTLVVDDQQDG